MPGFKTWAFLEKVSSADFNAYLQTQVVAQFTTAAQRDTLWPTPPKGAMCVTLDTLTLWQYQGGTPLGWTPPWQLPWGLMGVSRITTGGPTGITATPVTDTGLTVTWTMVNGRRYRTLGKVPVASTVAADVAAITLTDGANTQITNARVRCNTATDTYLAIATNSFGAVSNASQTHKLRVVRDSGTGFINTTMAATQPGELIVEDIGPG